MASRTAVKTGGVPAISVIFLLDANVEHVKAIECECQPTSDVPGCSLLPLFSCSHWWTNDRPVETSRICLGDAVVMP